MWAHQLQSRALRGFRVSGWSTTHTVLWSKGTMLVRQPPRRFKEVPWPTGHPLDCATAATHRVQPHPAPRRSTVPA
ncbi:hypothetical protein C5612_08960 [Pseudomonas frederiksbergensis]|uniref:Uncharacterized protein n=1 Tax=Pseudomonas frederiksbergensis TaxID=104087 RepID=A0A2S8HRY9_9PSED|nr:hypothetical protein C5612_08960 [Pseudomonas frederiksbergensis]